MPYPPPLFQTQGTNTDQAHFAAPAAARPWSNARGPASAPKKEVSGISATWPFYYKTCCSAQRLASIAAFCADCSDCASHRIEPHGGKVVQMMMGTIGESEHTVPLSCKCRLACNIDSVILFQIRRKDSERESIPTQLLQMQPCWVQREEDC